MMSSLSILICECDKGSGNTIGGELLLAFFLWRLIGGKKDEGLDFFSSP